MSSSPDELALVNAAKSFGVEFLKKDQDNYLEVKIHKTGVIIKYELLNVLEFNSTRKRNSVIVRNPDGQIELLCKGADAVLMPRLKEIDG